MKIYTYDQLVQLAKDDPSALLTPAEVAAIMRVDPKTVNRWSNAGRIRSLRTIGGHRRLFAVDVVNAARPQEETPVVESVV